MGDVVRVAVSAALVLDCVVALWLAAALLRHQYTEYHERWVADGRPIVTFFMPPEVGIGPAGFPSLIAGARVYFSWMWSTPDWMRDDERARSLLWWVRVTTLVWNVGFFPMVFLLWPLLPR